MNWLLKHWRRLQLPLIRDCAQSVHVPQSGFNANYLEPRIKNSENATIENYPVCSAGSLTPRLHPPSPTFMTT